MSAMLNCDGDDLIYISFPTSVLPSCIDFQDLIIYAHYCSFTITKGTHGTCYETLLSFDEPS